MTTQETTQSSDSSQKESSSFIENFKFVSQINSQNLSFLVYSPQLNHHFILHAYPYKKNTICLQYQREARTSFLDHPNILFRYFKDDVKSLRCNTQTSRSSIILQESFERGSLLNYKAQLSPDESLVRTIFHQVLSAVEHMHENEVAHLDIKPESIMISNDLRVKVANLGNCWKKGDKLKWRGSKYFRAPELMIKGGEDFFASDVFSLGIVLFTMMADGILPQHENEIRQGCFFYELMENDQKNFWLQFCEKSGQKLSKFSREFQELFHGMTRSNPKERMTLKDIKKSNWYCGATYSENDFKRILGSTRTF